MTKFFMLCGVSGCGKSIYAKKLAKEERAIIHSSDDIREELFGFQDQSNNGVVFQTLHNRVKKDLSNNINVIYDATNINETQRTSYIKELKNQFPDVYFACIAFLTSLEKCKDQNASRDRKVPEHVLDRMYKNYKLPTKQEGWDQIVLVK